MDFMVQGVGFRVLVFKDCETFCQDRKEVGCSVWRRPLICSAVSVYPFTDTRREAKPSKVQIPH